MAVATMPTPNPNAMKFVVGGPVGGPSTVTRESGGTGFAAELVGIDGVASVFFTADFVTITKSPSAEWDDIVAPALAILEAEFGA
jgi:NFU1 iron-sulfur cluster scaffold homolog, mitochondrial